MNNNIRINIKEAAQMMGASEDFLREAIKQKWFPFGVAVKSKGGRRHRFFIIRKPFEEWLESGAIFHKEAV